MSLGDKPDEKITYRRTVLYDEVWKDPVRTVARRYGVSDVALSKVCRRLQVPLPWSGYWAQIRAGQQIRRPPLPPVPIGAPIEVVSRRLKRPAAEELRKELPPVERTIVVPSKLQKPHALVSEAARLLRGREPVDGLVWCWGTRCLDISVSPASLGRALRIMNALILALENRALRVEVTPAQGRREEGDPPSNATRVRIHDEWIQFGLTEKRLVVRDTAPDPPKWLRGPQLESWLSTNSPQRKLLPNGRLALTITNAQYMGVRSVWQDGKRKKVEGCLDDFVVHLGLAAEAKKRHREDLARIQRERQAEEVRQLERERQRREEAERVREFEGELRRWRLARDAREYVAEIRGLLESATERPSGSSPSLEWIEGFARRIDPLTDLRLRAQPPARAGMPAEPTLDRVEGESGDFAVGVRGKKA
jgi:hypothetical protein